jgi:hypothetical protein
MDVARLACAGDTYCLYLADYREHLPVNTRLVSLAEALGWIEHQAIGLRGDALLGVLLLSGNDIDIPEVAVREAEWLGLLNIPAGHCDRSGISDRRA